MESLEEQPATRAIATFFGRYPKERYEANQFIPQHRRSQAAVFYLIAGSVRQYAVYAEKGSVLTLHVYGPGAYFPLSHLLTSEEFGIFEAVEPGVLHRAPVAEFQAFLASQPAVLHQATTRLAQAVNSLNRRLAELAFFDLRQRVIATLIGFTEKHSLSTGDGSVVVGPVTHQYIAEYLGATREATSLHLEQLVKEGLIAQEDQQIRIPNLEALSTQLPSSNH